MLKIFFSKGIVSNNIDKFELETSCPEIIRRSKTIIVIEIISSIVLKTDNIRYIKKTFFSLFVRTSIRVEDNFLNAKSFEIIFLSMCPRTLHV
jgi:hypothetical protein